MLMGCPCLDKGECLWRDFLLVRSTNRKLVRSTFAEGTDSSLNFVVRRSNSCATPCDISRSLLPYF